MPRPVVRAYSSIYRVSGDARGERAIPEETAVAFTFNTASYAVMMATPQDLEDFAIGFQPDGGGGLVGVMRSTAWISSRRMLASSSAIWLKAPHAAEFLGRRRKMAGPTGCGLCGIESLVEAMRLPPKVQKGLVFTPRPDHDGD